MIPLLVRGAIFTGSSYCILHKRLKTEIDPFRVASLSFMSLIQGKVQNDILGFSMTFLLIWSLMQYAL